MSNKKYIIYCIVILILFYNIIACGSNVGNVQSTKTITINNLITLTKTKNVPIINSPTATKEIISSLPNNLFFIKTDPISEKLQIFMLTSDIKNILQITKQADGVSDYDVSQLTGNIVFVVKDKLVIYNIENNSIQEIVNNLPKYTVRISECCGNPLEYQVINSNPASIVEPMWSSDGNMIVFYKNGVSAYYLDEKTEIVLIHNGENNLEYYPYEISPDSEKILVETNWNDYYIYFIETKQLVKLSNKYQSICKYLWSTDSEHILCFQNTLAGGGEGIMIPGLWIFDLSGSVNSVTHHGEETDNLPERVFAPRENIDGKLYLLYSELLNNAINNYYLVSSNSETINSYIVLRNEQFLVGQLNSWIWTKDGNALILDQNKNDKYELLLIPINKNIPLLSIMVNIENIQKLKWGT